MKLKKLFIGTLCGVVSAGMFFSSAEAAFTVCASGTVTEVQNSYSTDNPYYITIDCDNDTGTWTGPVLFMVGGTAQADAQSVYATALTAMSTGYKVTAGVGNPTAWARLLTLALVAP